MCPPRTCIHFQGPLLSRGIVTKPVRLWPEICPQTLLCRHTGPCVWVDKLFKVQCFETLLESELQYGSALRHAALESVGFSEQSPLPDPERWGQPFPRSPCAQEQAVYVPCFSSLWFSSERREAGGGAHTNRTRLKEGQTDACEDPTCQLLGLQSCGFIFYPCSYHLFLDSFFNSIFCIFSC